MTHLTRFAGQKKTDWFVDNNQEALFTHWLYQCSRIVEIEISALRWWAGKYRTCAAGLFFKLHMQDMEIIITLLSLTNRCLHKVPFTLWIAIFLNDPITNSFTPPYLRIFMCDYTSFPALGAMCHVTLPQFTNLGEFCLHLNTFEGPFGGIDDDCSSIPRRNGTPHPTWLNWVEGPNGGRGNRLKVWADDGAKWKIKGPIIW